MLYNKIKYFENGTNEERGFPYEKNLSRQL